MSRSLFRVSAYICLLVPKTSNMDYGYVQDSTAKPSLCENSIEHAHAGVQTITPDVVLYFDEEIKEIEGICLHNAEVCRSRNEGQKMDAWHLVATVVRSRAHSTGNGFDGWRGSNGGAMGELLLENLLRYFESLGDVQMLSSLVCTLRRNDSRKTVGKRRFMSLLPANQDARYDRYIRRYADLVFGWRLLTLRAELTKHLARSIAVVEALGRDVSAGLDESTSVSLEFTCPRCHERSERGYCQFCNNYAFQCVICDVAVRGLFTSCDR